LGDDDALALAREFDLGEDLERDVVRARRELLGDRGRAEVVGVLAALGRRRPVEDAAQPERLQLLDLVRMLVGDVLRLGPVLIGVEELPAVVLEVPEARDRTVLGDRLPAAVPDAAVAHHLVVLGLLAGRSIRLERVGHGHAGQRRLLGAVDDFRHLDPARLEDRRVDVDGVVELVSHLALGLDPLRPGDDERVADAALVDVALEHPIRRRERHCPTGRVVVVGLGAAQLVQHGQVVLDRVRVRIEELVLVDRAVRAALARGAVVGAVEDDRVLELP
jgi:hypothetical protein